MHRPHARGRYCTWEGRLGGGPRERRCDEGVACLDCQDADPDGGRDERLPAKASKELLGTSSWLEVTERLEPSLKRLLSPVQQGPASQARLLSANDASTGCGHSNVVPRFAATVLEHAGVLPGSLIKAGQT